MTFMELLRKILSEYEGLELEAYQDSVHKLWHIGYGHKLEQEQSKEELAALGLNDELEDWKGFTITQEQADTLLDIDVQDAIEDLSPAFTQEDIDSLNEPRRAILISMAFQLGGGGVRKFKDFIGAVKNKDWQRAHDEMVWSDGDVKERRSAWYRQTQRRCQESADVMRTGRLPGEPEPRKFVEQDIDLTQVPRELLLQELIRREKQK